MSARQALAHGFPVSISGAEWTFSPLTQDDRGALETLVRRLAFEALKDLRDVFGEQEFREQVAALRKDIARGHYNAGGDAYRDTETNEYFVVEVVFLSLRHRHPDMTRDDARRLLIDDPASVDFGLKMVSPNAEDARAVEDEGGAEGEQRRPFQGAQRPTSAAARS